MLADRHGGGGVAVPGVRDDGEEVYECGSISRKEEKKKKKVSS